MYLDALYRPLIIASFPRQLQAPIGYNPAVYGPWPRRGATIIKMFLPPSWKTTYSPANYKTITMLFNNEHDVSLNPLMMPDSLVQLLDWNCPCRGGLRTVCSCTHRTGALELLCYAEGIDSAKVQEPVTIDTAR